MPVSPERMETLARQEHDRWMNDLVRDGWTYSSGAKDPMRKTHPLIVSWEELDETEREKDRDVDPRHPAHARAGRLRPRRTDARTRRRLRRPAGESQCVSGRFDVGEQLVHADEAAQLAAHLDDLGGLGMARARRARPVREPARC